MMTKTLIANGASKVYIAGHPLEPLEAAAASLGPKVVAIHCDVTSREHLKRAVQTVKDDTGYLNLVVCNAGAIGPGGEGVNKNRSVERFSSRNFAYDIDSYLRPFAVNTAGVWYTAVAMLPLLDAGNKKGNVSQTSQVIVTASGAGLIRDGDAGWAYAQSKAASIHAFRQLATLLPQWKMRANCLAPGGQCLDSPLP